MFVLERKNNYLGKYRNSVFFTKEDYPWEVDGKNWGFEKGANDIPEDVRQKIETKAHDLTIEAILTVNYLNITAGLMSIETLVKLMGWKQLKHNSAIEDIKASLGRLNIRIVNAADEEVRPEDLTAKEQWKYSLLGIKAYKEGGENVPAPYVEVRQAELVAASKIARKPTAHIKLSTLLMMLLFIKTNLRLFRGKNKVILGAGGFVAMSLLSKVLGVSLVTARKFVSELDEAGLYKTESFKTAKNHRSPMAFMQGDIVVVSAALKAKWYKQIGLTEEQDREDAMNNGIKNFQRRRDRLNNKNR